MPTSASQTYSAHRCDPLFNARDAKQLPVQIAASTTLTRGTVLGEVSASPGTYAAYASGNTDGTQNPKGILEFDVVTDSSGNITNFGDFSGTFKTVPMFVNGYFDISTLIDGGSAGITATVVGALNGLVVEGVASGGRYTTGIVKF